VRLTLMGTTDLGQSVTVTTTTAADGSYHFTGLLPGIYKITQTPPGIPSGFTSETTTANAGTVNGTTDGTGNGNVIGSINLRSGNNGINYSFTDVFAGS
jgi:hypothetical protein